MFIIIGVVVVFGSIIGGYTLHHGNLAVLMQVSEFIIIIGAGIGATIISNPAPVLKRMVRDVMGLARPNPFTEAAYRELLQVLFELFQTARRDGLIGVESHVENPSTSPLFGKYPFFSSQKVAIGFLTDTVKVLLTGAVEEHHLSEILDTDLDKHHEEAMTVPIALNKLGDAMPGFGIVAAVLGVIITMGEIGGPPEQIGSKVAAALVGTMLGILLSYGLIGPLAAAVEARVRAEHAYLSCMRIALLAFARGDSPMTVVEFTRRSIEPGDRPSFAALEGLVQRRAA